MDFKEQIRELAGRIGQLKEHIETEEATKNAFIMPFLQILGFNIFNPLEVVPEFTTDIGTKKGEKVDYAIIKDGEPILLIECKHWAVVLDSSKESQLLRYFGVSKAKFALLTNGIEYRFYSDLDQQNVMDKTPFLAFDITKIKDVQIAELKKFSKNEFDKDLIIASASELKYTSALRESLQAELNDPSPEFTTFFTRNVYHGKMTQKVVEQFQKLLKRTVDQYLSDLITDRFKSAMETEKAKEEAAKAKEDAEKLSNTPDEEVVVTTEEELEGYRIVKAIVCQKIHDSSRVTYRDAKSYFTILLDNNVRKPICRLYYNRGKKYIGLFNNPKNYGSGIKEDNRADLPDNTPNEGIYNYVNDLLQTVEWYENPELIPAVSEQSQSSEE